MKLYLTHSTDYDYKMLLYTPLKKAFQAEHDIFLPHESDSQGVESRKIITTSDVVLAEVSLPSTGQGIELGWANDAGVNIVCFYQKGTKPSGALRFISKTFIEYSDSDALIAQFRTLLKNY